MTVSSCLTLNLLSDLYLMSIPVMMLWDARLKRAKKFSLMMLFTAWVFVTVAGVLRCAFVLAVSCLLQPLGTV